MKSNFSTSWKSSVQPRKQRKYRRNAPYHLRQSLLSTHLSAELRKQHGKRNIGLRKNDTVKILKGGHKGQSGKINSINTGKTAAYIDGIEATRRDGTKSLIPIQVSNLMITELEKGDSKRIKNGKKSS